MSQEFRRTYQDLDSAERRLIDRAIEEAMKASRLLPKESERLRGEVADLLTGAYFGLSLQTVQDGLAANLRIPPHITAAKIFPRVDSYSDQLPQEAVIRLALAERQRVTAVVDEVIGDRPARAVAGRILAHTLQKTLPPDSAINRLVTLGVDLASAQEAVSRITGVPVAGEPASPAAVPGAAEAGESADQAGASQLSEAVAQRVQALKRVRVLSSLADEAIQMMAGRVATLRLKQDDAVVRQGEPGDALYIITEGSVRVEVNRNAVATLKTGDVLGEMALVTGARRNATVLVEDPTATFLRLTDEDFAWFSQHFPEFKRSIAALAQSRLPTLFPGERNLINDAVARVSRLSADQPGVSAILTRAYLGQLDQKGTREALRAKHGIPMDLGEGAFSRVSPYENVRPAERRLLDPIIEETMQHGATGPLGEDVRTAIGNVLTHLHRGLLELAPVYQRLIALGVVNEYADSAARRAAGVAA